MVFKFLDKLMKLLAIFIPITLMLLFVIFFTNNSTSEHYTFKEIGSWSLKKSVTVFKKRHPQYKVFEVLINGEKNEIGMNSCEDYYCSFSFYFEDLDIIAYCNMFNGDNFSPTLFFQCVEFKNKRGFYGEKYINTCDLSWFENQRIKRKFEKEILNNLGDWESNSIFYSFLSWIFSWMMKNWIWVLILWGFSLISYGLNLFHNR